MNIWQVKIQNMESHQIFYTFLHGLTELSTFLAGVNRNLYIVREIKGLEAGTIKEPEHFFAREAQLELGVN